MSQLYEIVKGDKYFMAGVRLQMKETVSCKGSNGQFCVAGSETRSLSSCLLRRRTPLFQNAPTEKEKRGVQATPTILCLYGESRPLPPKQEEKL